jgi:AraC-like DNA-binding protein
MIVRMKRLFYFLLLLLAATPNPANAQLFRHISLKDGMVSRHVISLCKDRTGYMWMLNHEGVERYDGSRMVHYDLKADEGLISPTRGLASLATDSTRTLWVISHTGDIFSYDEQCDAFVPALDFARLKPLEGRCQPITSSYMDTLRHGIWLCTRSAQYLFSLSDHHLYTLPTGIHQAVHAVVHTPHDEYFLATDEGVKVLRLDEALMNAPSGSHSTIRKFTMKAVNHPLLERMAHVRVLYFHPDTHLLVLATANDGLYLYNIATRKIVRHLDSLKDVEVSTLTAVPGNREEVFVATQGAGLYRLCLTTGQLTPFLQANPNTPHSLQSDIINQLYIDESRRLWMATYPMGVSVYSEEYPAHEWICHSYNNANSLSSGQVHSIIEDGQGDLWFATNDGISCRQGDRWTTLLTHVQSSGTRRNYTFTSLCDLGDGRILAGGYMSGLYLIHKAGMKAEPLPVADKYIRAILRTHNANGLTDGLVWVGGQSKLTVIQQEGGRIVAEYRPGFPISSLAEQDADHLWIGTLNGLYRLNRRNGHLTRIEPHTEMGRITDICPTTHGVTYFSTMGDGLWAYADDGRFTHYTARNSSLVTDDIYCVLPTRDGRLVLSTEQGITTFNPREQRFYHWSHDQGLMFTTFNPGSGLHTRSGRYLFGTEQGALAFSDTVTLQRPFHSRLVLDDLRICYRKVVAADADSPLQQSIDRTESLTLRHDQNIFSMEVSSINFDNPSSILYSWKLEGFYDDWSAPSAATRIRYTSLRPGHYRLRIRSLLADDLSVIHERTLQIEILPPWWLTWPALAVYVLLMVGGCILICRLIWKRRERRRARNAAAMALITAQEVMEPIQTLKQPLTHLQNDHTLSQEGREMVNQALRQTESLDEIFMRRVADVVEQNLHGSGLSVDALCSELGISRTTLYHRLKSITGEAPADYIRRIRLDESARLLLTHRYTIAEVSDMMGFNDPKYFTDVFKRYYGTTPSQYIKQHLAPKREDISE